MALTMGGRAGMLLVVFRPLSPDRLFRSAESLVSSSALELTLLYVPVASSPCSFSATSSPAPSKAYFSVIKAAAPSIMVGTWALMLRILIAVARASSAFTSTSGVTPLTSHVVPVMGLTDFAVGTVM